MDIEGSELEVFPDLLVTGGFRNVDKVFMEWHEAITSNREGRKELMKKVFESNAFLSEGNIYKVDCILNMHVFSKVHF